MPSRWRIAIVGYADIIGRVAVSDKIIVVSMTEEERDALRRLPMALILMERYKHLAVSPPVAASAPSDDDVWLTDEQVRTLCRCHICRVRKAKATGALPSTEKSRGKGGKLICYVKRDDAMRWMEQGRPESI